MRGMVVEDDYAAQQSLPYKGRHVSAPQLRMAPSVQQQRQPYNTYTVPNDYSAYYSGQTALEYPYGFDPYRNPDPHYGANPAPASSGLYTAMSPQSVHPATLPDLHRQHPGLYYDYAASRAPASQYFYPHQPMVFHSQAAPHSPHQAYGTPVNPQMDKRRQPQVCSSLFSFFCMADGSYSRTLSSSSS